MISKESHFYSFVQFCILLLGSILLCSAQFYVCNMISEELNFHRVLYAPTQFNTTVFYLVLFPQVFPKESHFHVCLQFLYSSCTLPSSNLVATHLYIVLHLELNKVLSALNNWKHSFFSWLTEWVSLLQVVNFGHKTCCYFFITELIMSHGE